MKNSMQLKAYVKNLAKKKGLSPQLILQNYLLERFLERISKSIFCDAIILKGGLLIASMVGIDSRATMDMDTTIKGYPLTMKSVESMIEKICAVSLHDGFSFHIKEIDNIHEHNDYEGYRVGLEAEFGTIRAPLKLDITTGDIITPCETTYGYQLMFEDRSIPIKAYNLETILAEKIETIISRGDLNTRMRDYYDVYALLRLGKTRVNWDLLRRALFATATKRNTEPILNDWRRILETIRANEAMNKQWASYRWEYEYAKFVSFEETCDAVFDALNGLSRAESDKLNPL